MNEPSTPPWRTMAIGPVAVADTNRAEALGFLLARLSARQPTRVAFANANTVRLAMDDDAYAAVLGDFVVLSDGVGVDLAAKLVHGRPFAENLNGTDFTPAFLASLPKGTRVFLLGGEPGIAEEAATAWRAVFSDLTFVGTADGYFEMDEAGTARAAAAVAAAKADVLLVAMGNPRQEMLIAAMGDAHGAVLALGVGALFDFVAGKVTRAPRWVQRVRAEFLWRLAQEPRRLLKRYTVETARFGMGVAAQRRALKGRRE